ncbi:MAG: N-acetyltransferase [Elusimicrobiota bacterium]
MIEVKPFDIASQEDLMRFIKFQWKVYKGDKSWVPPLIMDMKAKFSLKANPFFLHSQIQPFLAYKDDKIVGRIVGIINNNHNKACNEKTGFFGFFETFQDYEVAESLIDRVADWVKSKGMDTLRGPANFSSNDDWGTLIDNFNESPMLLMPYNPPYYKTFLEKYGFEKAKDVFAYKMLTEHVFPERILKIIEYAKKKQKISIRNLNIKAYWDEVKILKKIYNNAWEQNWGFVPMTDEEFDHMAKELKAIVDPKFCFFVMYDNNPVGLSVCLPNANEALIKIRNGKLFPFGLLKLLYYIKKVKSGRLLILGVVKEFRNKGIEPMLFNVTLHAAREAGWEWGEMSWVLEDNVLMRNSIEKAGGTVYKTYRIFEKNLT